MKTKTFLSLISDRERIIKAGLGDNFFVNVDIILLNLISEALCTGFKEQINRNERLQQSFDR